MSDADAEEALRYVVHLKHVRALLRRHSLPEVCPACGVSSLDMGPTSRPHDSNCAVWSAIEALDLQQGHVAVAVAFDMVRELMARQRINEAARRFVSERIRPVLDGFAPALDIVGGIAQRRIAEGELVRFDTREVTFEGTLTALDVIARRDPPL